MRTARKFLHLKERISAYSSNMKKPTAHLRKFVSDHFEPIIASTFTLLRYSHTVLEHNENFNFNSSSQVYSRMEILNVYELGVDQN